MQPEKDDSGSIPVVLGMTELTPEQVKANFAPAPSESGLPVQAVPDSISQPRHLFLSTLVSLMVVLILMIAVRLIVPPLVESIRYSWFRGQLRAEYELSGQRLNAVSLDSLAEVSKLISQRIGPSVVHLNLMRGDSEEFIDLRALRLADRPTMLGQGSGFIIDSAGHILTNQHVIAGVENIEVALSDGRRVEAAVLRVDPLTDLAVLRIEADGLMPITWGDSDRVDVGTPVWAVGSPFGLEQSVTFGILSGKHRVNLKGIQLAQADEPNPVYGDLMQSDVALNPGNSGGPLVNASGEVVGVNTAIVGESFRGISFSIPSKVAKAAAQRLIAEGPLVRGWMGLSLRDVAPSDLADSSGKQIRGAFVQGLAPSGPSPAGEAGMLPGDVIVEFDGMEVVGFRALMPMISMTKVDSTVKVIVLRGGQRITLDVKIARRPASADRSTEAK